MIVALMVGGCVTSTVDTDLDLNSPWKITVLHGKEELKPSTATEREIEMILKNWLPRMRTAVSTYPTPRYRIRVVAASRPDAPIEEIIFVGSNWIGDGRGIATLADTQAFRLWKAIDETIANQAEHSTE